MKAGKLRHLVEIQQLVEVPNEYGELEETYVKYADAYAEIRPLLGRENFAEKQLTSEQTHKIKMRFIPGVTASMRVIHGTKIYELIGYPVNWEERNIFLTFNAEEKYNHDMTVPPANLQCITSVGGIYGYNFSIDGTWEVDCPTFKK